MRLSTGTTLALTVLLAVATVGAAAAAPADPAPDPALAPGPTDADRPSPAVSAHSDARSAHPSTADGSNASLPERPDTSVVIRVNATSDGDARWTIQHRFLLTDDEDETVFREYAASVVAGDADVDHDPRTFERAASRAESSTDRRMSIENAGWDDPIVVETNEDGVTVGIIPYSFTWTNFAAADDERVYFGDAFLTEDGPWLSLADGQRLEINPPPGYGLESAATLQWEGPHEFAEDELAVVFLRGGGPPWAPPWWMVAGAGLAVVAIGAGGYFLASRVPAVDLPFVSGSDSSDEEDSPDDRRDDAPNPGPDPAAEPTGAAGLASDGAVDDVAAAAGQALEFDESVDDDVDPELLSDEERVQRLLKQNGGRMKQASIVDETGWSNAKVSQLLSKMDDDAEIEKLRIGRENLITLPEIDPTEMND